MIRYIFTCRRTVVALFSITCLTWIALEKGVDTSTAISAVAIGLAGANAFEKSKTMGKAQLP
jgi:hypothetical protein